MTESTGKTETFNKNIKTVLLKKRFHIQLVRTGEVNFEIVDVSSPGGDFKI